MTNKKFILYRIYYGDTLVYLGRTKQSLQTRIHEHLFKKPMARSLFIEQISKIEYTEFKTEADMNVYEIYFINLWKPPLNVDDKAKDALSVRLPDVQWNKFETHLWDKWKKEIHDRDIQYDMHRNERAAMVEARRLLYYKRRDGKISEEEFEKAEAAWHEKFNKVEKNSELW